MMDPVSRLSVDEGHYWVYVLRCNDGTYYQGYSANLRRQLRAMALGISSKRVAEHLPLCLVGARPHSNREESAQSRDELKTCTDERLADIASEAGWYSGLDLRQALIGNNVGDLRLISTVWRDPHSSEVFPGVVLEVINDGSLHSPDVVRHLLGLSDSNQAPPQPVIERDIDIYECTIAAASEVLEGRDRAIFIGRYASPDTGHATLASIGLAHDMSRERVRQLLTRYCRKIRAAGNRQIKRKCYDSPSAQLMILLRYRIQLDEPQGIDRLFQVAMNDMAYLSPRIAFRFLLSLSGCKAQQSSSHMREMAEKLKEYRSSYRESLRSRKRQGGLFNFLLRETYWSKRQESATGSAARFLEAGRAREVQLAREHAGTYYSEKLRRNVQFESALEMKFLLRIEQLDEITAYQEQPFSLGYQLDGVQRRYYPDVLLQLQDGQMIVVEVKPLWQMAFRENLAKWSALKIYCELQGLGLLITDGKKSIRSLIDYQVPPSLQDVILDELRQGPMPLRRLIQLRTIRSPQLKSVAAMVLQQKLVWSGTSLAITQAEIAK